MKKAIYVNVCVALFILLFSYTAISKFLDYNLFVFQMLRAPLPIMKTAAPVLGWAMPIIEILLVIGLLFECLRLKALLFSVLLMCAFEIYIAGMLLTNQHLPCTCGGIISTMSWTQHLFFNGVFILMGTVGIYQYKKQNLSRSTTRSGNDIKELSRA